VSAAAPPRRAAGVLLAAGKHSPRSLLLQQLPLPVATSRADSTARWDLHAHTAPGLAKVESARAVELSKPLQTLVDTVDQVGHPAHTCGHLSGGSTLIGQHR